MDDGLLTLVIWVLLAIACAAVANGKGRRAWVWAIWGIVGGLVAFLVLICMPKIVPVKKCPICANELKQEAMMCHFCGYDFINRKLPSQST